MLKGKTKSGFKFEVEDDRLNNYELVEAISEVSDGNPLALTKVIKLLLGEDEAKSLKDHVRDEKGLVPSDKLSDEVMEIFQSEPIKK